MKHPIQSLINSMSAQWQRERSETQMTLGELIDRLESMPEDATIEGIGEPHSYRGYYSDVALERTEGRIPAKVALIICQGAVGKIFMGYKGGEFTMCHDTPVWIANYGDCGEKLMAIRDDGTLELAEDI